MPFNFLSLIKVFPLYKSPFKGALSLFPLKTNVMNYGITLLKCFYGNNFKIKISDNEIILPENSDMSDDFKKFLS